MTLEILTALGRTRVRVLARDKSWRDGAGRAVRRAFGRGARAWGWKTDHWTVDAAGQTMTVTLTTSVVGRREGGGWPIIGSASIVVPASVFRS